MTRPLILLSAILLVGCSPGDRTATLPQNREVKPTFIRYDLPEAWAYEFRLEDGTHCVSYYKSITCDFTHPTNAEAAQ